MATSGGQPEWEPVSFREDPAILEKVDRLVKFRTSDRSSIYREAIRYFLDNLSDREKKLFTK